MENGSAGACRHQRTQSRASSKSPLRRRGPRRRSSVPSILSRLPARRSSPAGRTPGHGRWRPVPQHRPPAPGPTAESLEGGCSRQASNHPCRDGGRHRLSAVTQDAGPVEEHARFPGLAGESDQPIGIPAPGRAAAHLPARAVGAGLPAPARRLHGGLTLGGRRPSAEVSTGALALRSQRRRNWFMDWAKAEQVGAVDKTVSKVRYVLDEMRAGFGGSRRLR